MTGTDLRGFAVAITADRRRDEQAVLFERLGVEVLLYPLLHTEADDLGALRDLTEKVASAPPDYLLANTGYGMRAWLSLAAQWDQQEALVSALKAHTTIAARGAKALGELRKVGLDAWYKAPGETLDEVVDRLLQEDLAGRSVLFQLHGEPSTMAVARLRQAGAEVTCAPVYRMGEGGVPAGRAFVQAIVDGTCDAVTFTAAPQVQALARAAAEMGQTGPVVGAFNVGGVTAVCIGDVCAGAARVAGMSGPLVPEHPRLGSMVTAVAGHLSQRRMVLAGRGGPVKVSGRLVHANGHERWLGPAEQRALRVLGQQAAPAPLQALGGASEEELRRLAGTLDEALDISRGQYRLLVAGRR